MMGFFLLGRSADDTLSLLSARTFESRQDALAELSRITASPDFTRWDDDVILFDSAAGTPVLLVRAAASSPSPAATPEVGPVAAEVSARLPEPAAFAAIADEELVVTPISVPASAEAPVQPDAPVEPDVPVESAESAEDDTSTRLRDAIARTTEHMEASGIAAPASVGPVQVEPEPAVPPRTPLEPAPEPTDPTAPDASEPPTAAPDMPEPAVPAWPWDTPIAEPAFTDRDIPAQTQDKAESHVADALDSFEEPLPDTGGSLITTAVDPQGSDDSGPVVLGTSAQPAADATAPEVNTGTPQLEPDTIALDPVPAGFPATAAAEAATTDDDVLPLSSYVCGDCVYAATCPNRDQRLPKDCGSFQWK